MSRCKPSLDESWWTLRGGLDGIAGAVIDQALTDRADKLPELPDGSIGSNGWKRAIALYELASGGTSPQGRVTVFVNAEQATPTNGKAGVRLQVGPRVGAEALSAILCDSFPEITVIGTDGIPMQYGRSSRIIPPALRRAVLATELVDSDGDHVADTPFNVVLANAEAVRLNPASTESVLHDQLNLLQRIHG